MHQLMFDANRNDREKKKKRNFLSPQQKEEEKKKWKTHSTNTDDIYVIYMRNNSNESFTFQLLFQFHFSQVVLQKWMEKYI